MTYVDSASQRTTLDTKTLINFNTLVLTISNLEFEMCGCFGTHVQPLGSPKEKFFECRLPLEYQWRKTHSHKILACGWTIKF
jgi:hypothetical protein